MDGGATWERMNVGTAMGRVEKVFFPDASRGWLLVNQEGIGSFEGSLVYHTWNGGISWKNVLSIKSAYASGAEDGR
jgi:photosystem II stability/assembly factor-like uncharacterized protein